MKTKKLIELARRCADSESNCNGCEYMRDSCSSYGCCTDDLMADLADRLEELHEKSKAKEVDDAIPFANGYIGICPNCGDVVGSTKKYCQNCGQKLKWGDN